MSKAIVLDNSFNRVSYIDLPAEFSSIKEHNLYLYIKYYLASFRTSNANVKTRGDVSGGGKKPWKQKGGGRARAGSITSPIFVGGGVVHGPNKFKNYSMKINKKQKRLALEYALEHKAKLDGLFVIDSINIDSGKTKDAFSIFKSMNTRNMLIICNSYSDKTSLAFRNINTCCLVDVVEVNAYLISAFTSILIEKQAFECLLSKPWSVNNG